MQHYTVLVLSGVVEWYPVEVATGSRSLVRGAEHRTLLMYGTEYALLVTLQPGTVVLRVLCIHTLNRRILDDRAIYQIGMH